MVFTVFNDPDHDPRQARDALKSISLTCRDFRRFTLSLLFETFVLHTLPRNSRPLPNRNNREIQRLDFYASDRIASFVSHLMVRPCIKGRELFAPASTTPATLHDSPLFLVSKFFDMLPRFVNARSLTGCEIDIRLHAFKNLSALPCLRSINLTDCISPSPNYSLRPLRLHAFSVVYPWNADSKPGAQRWLTLMDPSSLQVLRIDKCSASSLGCLFRDMPSAGLFPSLHALSLSGALDVLGMIVHILSNTPALHRLSLVLYPLMPEDLDILNAQESPTRHLVPYLELYRGSHTLLPHILRRPTSSMQSPSSSGLRRLDLYPALTGDDSLHAVINTLKTLCPIRLRHLTHFHASLTWADCSALESLCILFPELQELMLTPRNQCRPFTGEVGYGLFSLLFPEY